VVHGAWCVVRGAWCLLMFVSSSSPAGGSPVQVAATRPGSRVAASLGNWRGRSPASKAPSGGRCGPQRKEKPDGAG
jgi:hypothetical protein